MTLTSWLEHDREIKKMIVYVNVMLIYVKNIKRNFLKILIYVNFMKIYINITDGQTDGQTYQNYSSEHHNRRKLFF
jgi:hypothetical protein